MPSLKIGIVDRAVVSAEQIGAIADLPSRDVLLATLLGVLNAPASKLVRVLNEPASSLARLLKAKAEKDGAASPQAPAAPAEVPAETPAEVVEAPAA